MFARTLVKQTRDIIGRRYIISNPALNTNPAFRNPAIIPFGIDFIDNDLRQCLLDRDGVDISFIDNLERLYYQQCQQDAEFNNCCLPRSYDSKLWGFIYGERLISAKYQLDTINDDEKFMINYLREIIDELTMRMNRFYPNFDYKSQIEALIKENNDNKKDKDIYYENAYNEALADIIVSNPIKFIEIFKNNSFITDNHDSDDKFNDYLPENVENELINNYQFQWDFNKNLTSNFQSYFNRISKFENILSPKIDSLSKNLRKNFADFLLQCFTLNNLNDIKYIINMIESATTNSVISDNKILDDLNNDDLVKKCLDLLDETKGNSSMLISALFYGSNNVENEINNKSKQELISILTESIDNERLILINKSLQIYEYLKYNSMTRLILTCLINQYPSYFAQFLIEGNGQENIEKFESLNNNIFDEIISFQSIYYENGDDLINSFNSLIKSIENEINYEINLNEINLNENTFESPQCFITSIFFENYQFAKENNNILDEIKYLTFYKYITNSLSNITPFKLIEFLINPSRNDINNNLLKNMAFQFATNSSDATDILINKIILFCKQNTISIQSQSDIKLSIQSQLDNFRNICIEYNNSRNNLEESIKKITLNFDKTINFDHAKSNYHPLNTYLAQFRYYNNR